MRIAVTGSWPDVHDDRWPTHGTRETFEAACAAIGALLAAQHCTLVVQFDADHHADTHVARGYAEHARVNGRSNGQRIIVAKPEGSHDDPFAAMKADFPALWSTRTYRPRKWDSVRFLACVESDATLIIGGGPRTESTGYVVMAAGRSLVPLGCFGGAAAQLIDQAVSATPFGRTSPVPRDALEQEWSDAVLESLRTWLSASIRNPRIVIVHGRDTAARDALAVVLTSKLKTATPVIMQLEEMPGATLPEKWEKIAQDVDGAIILATPDDHGGLAGQEVLGPRARQNVWLELGWFWGLFRRRSRLMVLLRRDGDGKVPELPSDILGLEYHEFATSPVERAAEIESFVTALAGEDSRITR